MIELDTASWVLQKQVEIRQPTEKGYFFDIIWVRPSLKKGDTLTDGYGSWTIHETFGIRKMPYQGGIYQGAL